jgi:1-aminocyclopropane-1-carboxylate synthase
MDAVISVRAQPLRKGPLSYIDVFISSLGDLYSNVNTDGWIACVVAENKLSGNKKFLERLQQAPQAGVEVMNYGNMKGMHSLQNALCNLMSRTFVPGIALNSHNMCVLSGCTSVIDSLVFCLMNEGDGVLIPNPSYAAFDNDLKARARLKPLEFPLDERQGDIEMQLDMAVENASKRGITVRSLLITNPSNPLGTIYQESTIKTMLHWSMKNNVHYISDEIYGLSVHQPGIHFQSAMCTLYNDLVAPGIVSLETARSYFHLLYGLSKDWCASGLRVGCLYSDNQPLQEAMNSLAPMGSVSNYIQHSVADVLNDTEFTEKFVEENSRELRQSYAILTAGLDKLGIKYQQAQAGIFCWVDMRPFLEEDTFDGEDRLWKRMCDELKLIWTPGRSCHAPAPGYFRICFAWVGLAALEEMIARLATLSQKRSS